MASIAFDTLKFARSVEKAGFTYEQAVGLAESLAETHQQSLNDVATKGDILSVKGEFDKVRSEIDKVRGEIDKVRGEVDKVRVEMREMELRLIVKLGAMIFMLGGFLVAIKFFAP